MVCSLYCESVSLRRENLNDWVKIKTNKIQAFNDNLDAGLENENILAIEHDVDNQDARSEPPGDNDLQQLLIVLWIKWGADFQFVKIKTYLCLTHVLSFRYFVVSCQAKIYIKYRNNWRQFFTHIGPRKFISKPKLTFFYFVCYSTFYCECCNVQKLYFCVSYTWYKYLVSKEGRLSFYINLEVVNLEIKNPTFVFWEKLWLDNLVSRLTDL